MPIKNLIAVKQIRADQLSGYILDVFVGPSGHFQSQIDGLTSDLSGLSGSMAGFEDSLGDLSGLITGGLNSGQIINLVNHLNSGFSVNLSSGVESVVCSYGYAFSATPHVFSQVGSSNTGDPLILNMLSSKTQSGCSIRFSDTIRSSNYYLDLMIRV